ncbi:MAG TPA: acetylxylan esterase [Chitinophagaceae bacterium]|nr:acetylxylan esterase [Chitinophagaceae bacterium]
MNWKRSILAFISMVLISVSFAQPAHQQVEIVITPNHKNWEYKIGEPVTFSIQVFNYNVPMKDVKIVYQIGPEKMKPFKSDSSILAEGKFVTGALTMKEPGFLRCVVTTSFEGKQYRNLATAGFEPEKIQPTVSMPSDFEAFWKGAANELAKLPIDPKMTLMPERSSALTDVYHVNFQGYAASRIYGILCIPKKQGPHPAVLQVPGAGIRPYGPDLELADRNIIVLTIGIHGIPVNLDPVVYNNLAAGALAGYPVNNLNDRDRYYYKRVYANCIRAVDMIFSLPGFDGQTLAVMGGSQGGALSIITASLDKRVKFVASQYPALCDLTGYTKGRAGGWPHMLSESNKQWNADEKVINTLSYYDVVNFAKGLNAECHFTWGFNDETCPPTSYYAAYNSIRAKKKADVFLDTGHWTYPEQRAAITKWVTSKLIPGKQN